jgi:polyisoprenoid-binding protein YceI
MKKAFIYALVAATLMTACKKTETENEKPSVTTYQIVSEGSKIGWAGHMDGESNEGSFELESDGLSVNNGKVVGGSFSIPIASLNVLNLEGELKNMLETHLKSADFFNLAIHPNAKFVIKEVSPYNHADTEGVIPGANFLIKGDFTMLGKTKTIEFPAKITSGGNLINVVATLKINRLDYGMSYASDPNVPDHYIYPDVDLELVVFAKK